MAPIIKAVELIVSGRVQRVGYRDFVADVGRALKLAGFVQNLPDGTVKIRCKGEAAIVEEFKEIINVKNPPEAPLIKVESIAEKQLKEAEITEALFEERYGDLNVELLQAVSTGTKYIGHLSKELSQFRAESKSSFQDLGNKIDAGFNKTDANFGVLADKYGKISGTMERIDGNIEKMAKKDVFK